MREIHELQELKEKHEMKRLKAKEYNKEYNKRDFSNPANREKATNKRRELAAKKAIQKREQVINERHLNLQNDYNAKIGEMKVLHEQLARKNEEMKVLYEQLAKKNEDNQELLEENTMLQDENVNLQNCLNTTFKKKKDLEHDITVALACYA